jgi:hypothetical protein
MADRRIFSADVVVNIVPNSNEFDFYAVAAAPPAAGAIAPPAAVAHAQPAAGALPAAERGALHAAGNAAGAADDAGAGADAGAADGVKSASEFTATIGITSAVVASFFSSLVKVARHENKREPSFIISAVLLILAGVFLIAIIGAFATQRYYEKLEQTDANKSCIIFSKATVALSMGFFGFFLAGLEVVVRELQKTPE